MMKSLLKQVSLLMFCVAVSAAPVYAANSENSGLNTVMSVIGTDKNVSGIFSNANSAVDATRFLKGRKNDKKFRLFARSLGVGLVKDSSAFKDVHKQINRFEGKTFVNSFDVDGKSMGQGATGYINKIKNEFADGYRGNLSTFQMDTKQIGKDISEDIKTKARDIVSGRDAARLINEEVIDAMQRQAHSTSKTGGGVPTMDIANVTVGMFNLDSVFGAYHANEGVRDEDTRSCGIMGISPVTDIGLYASMVSEFVGKFPLVDRESPGFQCCVKWAAANESQMLQAASGNYASAAQSIGSTMQRLEQCCALSPELCLGKHTAKAECVNNQLQNGGDLVSGLQACAVECDKSGYGELNYRGDGTYDPSQVAQLVKSCEQKRLEWSPSPTVLTSDELAPVVPVYFKIYIN